MMASIGLKPTDVAALQALPLQKLLAAMGGMRLGPVVDGHSLPRDPFVLLTTDSGGSWRKQAIGEEDSPGTVQRFWFDSPQHGEVIVDAGRTAEGGRYRAYESENGGATWNLTGGSDRPPGLKHAPPDENTEWRVTASKDGKAIEIERHSDGAWVAVASFAIEVALCGK